MAPTGMLTSTRERLAAWAGILRFPLAEGGNIKEYVLWVGLHTYIDAAKMPPGCRVIATPTTGLTHIDLDAARERNITVLNLSGCDLTNVWATAEHTIALILALVRKIPAAVEHVRDGGWDRDQFRGRELRGKVALVIGHGRVGRQVHHLLNAFGMSVYTSNHDETTARWAPHADVVTLHENYEPSKRGKYGQAFFDSLKKGAVFVNTARGELVNEPMLWESLERGHLGGAALDVLADEYEPRYVVAIPNASHEEVQTAWNAINHRRGELVAIPSDCRFYEINRMPDFGDRLLITPHLGGCTEESQAKTELLLADKLIETWRREQGV